MVPGYCHHRPSGRGYARFGGRSARPTYFPGPFGSDTSRLAYARALAEFQATGRVGPAPDQGVTVAELVLAFLRHAEAHDLYHKGGRPTSEPGVQKAAFRRLLATHADEPAGRFGLADLDAFRSGLTGHAPKTAREYAGRIRSLFRWGEARGLVPPGTAARLDPPKGLGSGTERRRKRAVPRDRVRPADPYAVGAVALCGPPELRAMVWLQWLTGMRPGGVVALRPRDLDRSGPLWHYREPRDIAAKTGAEQHWIGPRAQAVLAPFLDVKADQFVFRPSRRPGRARHGRYTVNGYRLAVARLCERLGVEHFSPGQLRHSRATTVRRLYGIEAARAALGHTDISTTLIYAEQDANLARRVAAEIG